LAALPRVAKTDQAGDAANVSALERNPRAPKLRFKKMRDVFDPRFMKAKFLALTCDD
jgi:hypothetical protein